jgi:hypothetical protein
MRAYLQHAYGRAISSHTFGYHNPTCRSAHAGYACYWYATGLPGIQSSARCWVPGLRHPSRLLPTWIIIMPNSGKPEFGRAHPGMTRSHRSRKCECIPIPAPRACLILLASCPMRGASRGDPEVGQSESWPEGQPEGRCGARGCVSQTQTRGALGNRPGPLRGAAFNGWTGLEREGESLRDHGASLSSCRKHGPRDEETAAAGRWKAFPWPLFS